MRGATDAQVLAMYSRVQDADVHRGAVHMSQLKRRARRRLALNIRRRLLADGRLRLLRDPPWSAAGSADPSHMAYNMNYDHA